jgi:hypothetical protein
VSELHRRSDRRLSAKLVLTFPDRRCHVVSVADPYGCIFGFLDRSHYFSFQIAPQLYSRSWVDPFHTHYSSENLVAQESNPDSWICSQEPWPLDHGGGPLVLSVTKKWINAFDYKWNNHDKAVTCPVQLSGHSSPLPSPATEHLVTCTVHCCSAPAFRPWTVLMPFLHKANY